jgi:polar amino acid transport system substrate-binding protein
MIQSNKIVGVFTMAFIGGLGLSDGAFGQCAPAHQLKTLVPGTLTVTTLMLPPYNIPGNDGSMTGVEGDILKKIAGMECLKLDVKQVDPAAEIQYVVAGKADMSAGNWMATEARAKVLSLSAPLYLDAVGIYSKEGFTKFSQLSGTNVGTVQGYNWVSALQAIYGDKLKLYPTPVALAQDLAAGRVDTAVDSPGAGLYAQKKGGYQGFKIRIADPDPRVPTSLTPAQMVFLYAKDNTALRDAIDADIAVLKKNGGIADALTAYGLDAKTADTGPARLMK